MRDLVHKKPKMLLSDRISRRVIAVSLCLASIACLGAGPREAHVAGSFYPDGSDKLRRTVSQFLDVERVSEAKDDLRILIAPHAGYRYSGSVAGHAFRHIKGSSYDGVVVVGFTHGMHFSGSSVDNQDSYETPLGLISADQDTARFLRNQNDSVIYKEDAHASKEHSLEVMLPFLQVALGEFKLIPILMGSSSFNNAEALADALAALSSRGEYLFVFSTDLSHYHPYDDAVRIDEVTVNSILSETPQALERLFASGLVEACGRGPIVTSMLLAEKLGYPKKELLKYANSGDTAGDRSRVVGYAAIGMFERNVQVEGTISMDAGMALVRAARESLERALIHGKEPEVISLEEYPELGRTSGVFVTLRRNGLLCGCIGRIESNDPLAESVPFIALDAALRDARFPPVKAEDLEKIHIEVSVLTPPRRLVRIQDLVPGRDGVVLEADGRRGVFLPSVWTETGWTRTEFLRQLSSQKAHLEPDAWKRATLYIFEDQVFEESVSAEAATR